MGEYTISLSEGTVTRNSDGKVIAPCQSYDDADFQQYLTWVEVGGTPDEVA